MYGGIQGFFSDTQVSVCESFLISVYQIGHSLFFTIFWFTIILNVQQSMKCANWKFAFWRTTVFFQGHLLYLCINRFCWYLCFTAEEKPESKGKKVMGVGLGNIFEGGPIKLRSTAATAKRPVEKVS